MSGGSGGGGVGGGGGGGGVLEGLFQSAADSPSSAASESSPVLNTSLDEPSPKRPSNGASQPNGPSSSSRRKPSSPSKVTVDKEGMFPVRVVVERVGEGRCPACQPLCASPPSPDSTTGGPSGLVLADSYAIVSGHTPFSQLVPTVLSALGLPHLAFGARGLVELKGWKPLDFAQVTADPDATVDSFLRDFATHLSLKILTKSGDSATSDCVADMKERLLKALLGHNPALLASIKSAPLRDFVTALLEGGLQAGGITSEHLDSFNLWLDELTKAKPQHNAASVPSPPAQTHQPQPHPTHQSHQPVLHRFNDKLEVPKLQRWFQENPNPTRQKVQQYMHLLNASNFRRHNAKISYQQMCNWFSNQRAVLRQKEASWESTMASLATAARLAASQGKGVFGGPDLRALGGLDFGEFMREQLNDAPAGDAASAGTKSSSESSPPPNGDAPMDLATTSRHEEERELKREAAVHDSSPSPFHSPAAAAASGLLDFRLAGSPVGGGNGALSSMLFSPPASRSPGAASAGPGGAGPGAGVSRSRLMFDPLTELPLLERWFEENPHPSWIQIDAFTETLNGMAYRRTYPPVSTHNVKIWFKNRRAKCKRLMGHLDNK